MMPPAGAEEGEGIWLAVDSLQKQPGRGGEGTLGLDWGVVARRLQEFVDCGEILAPEPVRGGHAIKLLRGRRDSDRDPFLACGVDREGEILGHQVGHEPRCVLPARSGAGAAVRLRRPAAVAAVRGPAATGRAGPGTGRRTDAAAARCTARSARPELAPEHADGTARA